MGKRSIPGEFDPEGFAAFWAMYPRKDAKQDAYKAWRQLQPTIEMQVEIRDALAWQVDLHDWATRPRFCPLPATYLRGLRWTDERPTPAKSLSAVTAAALRAIQGVQE